MSEAVELLKSQAGTLSDAERADLAYYLLSSLEPKKEDDVAEAWRSEIARRVADIRSGKGKPLEDVLAELRVRHS